MQTISYAIPELLKMVSSSRFLIPQFQRDFVWNDAQVKLLIDSIARNYPIGSLLVMKELPEFALSARPIKAIISENTESDGAEGKGDILYVLDGQQRLTSIARAFLDVNSVKCYYFDLQSMLQNRSSEQSKWIVARQRGKTPGLRKDNNRLLRTDAVLDQAKTELYVSEYVEDLCEDYKDNKQAARKAAAGIKGIFEIIRNYQVPVVVLDRESSIDSICRVFETINSTGTRLTTFDLAVAKYYPQPNLREAWEQSKQDYPRLEQFDVDGERILQVIALWNARKRGQNYEPTRSALLNMDPRAIETKWNDACKVLDRAYSFAEDNGATPDTLPFHGVLVPIAAFMGVLDETTKRPTDGMTALLKRWFYCNILQAGARMTNYAIGQDFKMLLDYRDDEKRLPDFPKVDISVDKILRISKGSDNRFKALQCLMSIHAPEDLISGDKLAHHNQDTEDCHIFPRSLAKNNVAKPAELDSIANRVTLLKSTNRKLGNDLPSVYFRELQESTREQGTGSVVNVRLQNCMISGDILDESFCDQFDPINFQFFLRNRARVILDRVRETVGSSLVESSGEAEPDQDNDE